MVEGLEKTKNLGIRATEARRKDLRRLSADRGLSVQALVDHAINEAYFSGREQTFPNPDAVASPFGTLTKDEERCLRAVLRFVRDTDKLESVAEDALKSIIRRWGRDKRE